MGLRLGNVAGRAVLVADGYWYDLDELSAGEVGPEPMDVVGTPTSSLVALADRVSSTSPTASGTVDEVTFDPPVPHPQKVFGVGLNYRAHAAEGGRDVPDLPLVFTKFPSCLVGPSATVELRGDRCDYEGELVVVIGSGGKDIAPTEAWDRVLGVTIGQDISDRTVQMSSSPPHFDLGKSFDTFGPIGPWIVAVGDLDARDDLRIVTEVNGEVRQDGRTSDMIFDVATLVSYLSHITTLVPGDLIFTGTPSGVGVAQGRFLADGDVITTTIDGIGTMTNPCVRSTDPPKVNPT